MLSLRREAIEATNSIRAAEYEKLAGDFHELCRTEREAGPANSNQIRATLRTDVCRLPSLEAANTTVRLSPAKQLSEQKPGSKRGRRPDAERRSAIEEEIRKHGNNWRDHLGEIFEELDRRDIRLGNFASRRIDLGNNESQRVTAWGDLDLAEGDERRAIVDVLRKYSGLRN